jgi:hypothetical protein
VSHLLSPDFRRFYVPLSGAHPATEGRCKWTPVGRVVWRPAELKLSSIGYHLKD